MQLYEVWRELQHVCVVSSFRAGHSSPCPSRHSSIWDRRKHLSYKVNIWSQLCMCVCVCVCVSTWMIMLAALVQLVGWNGWTHPVHLRLWLTNRGMGPITGELLKGTLPRIHWDGPPFEAFCEYVLQSNLGCGKSSTKMCVRTSFLHFFKMIANVCQKINVNVCFVYHFLRRTVWILSNMTLLELHSREPFERVYIICIFIALHC